MTLSRGVAEWEVLCRVRADGVCVRWGAFCVSGCLRTWLSVYLDVDPVVWWSVVLWPVVPWGGVKNLFLVHSWEYLWHSNFALFISQ